VLPYNYDDVQVYGHFVPADLRYTDERALAGQGFQADQTWEDRPAIKDLAQLAALALRRGQRDSEADQGHRMARRRLMTLELRLTADQRDLLLNHMFCGDGEEHGAVLACGVTHSRRGTRAC
jgi:hypothetical protein